MIPTPERRKEEQCIESSEAPPIHKDWKQSYVIAGSDMEALFLSLKDIESARIASVAVITSTAEFDNIDVNAALRYNLIVSGKCHLTVCGLGQYTPRWKG